MELTPSVLLSAAALAFAVWNFFRKESREDGQTSSQRLKKLESTVSDHTNLHTGQVQAQERLAESLKNTLDSKTADIERRTAKLESGDKEVQALRERMVKIETELQSLPRIEASVKNMNDLLMKFLSEK